MSHKQLNGLIVDQVCNLSKIIMITILIVHIAMHAACINNLYSHNNYHFAHLDSYYIQQFQAAHTLTCLS